MRLRAFDISIWKKAVEKEYIIREEERLTTLKKSIRILKGYFRRKGVRKVLLVGSILEKGKFFPFSDIDVAVEGLKKEYFRTMSEIEGLLGKNVDLIELDRCRFKDAIERNGMRIL